MHGIYFLQVCAGYFSRFCEGYRSAGNLVFTKTLVLMMLYLLVNRDPSVCLDSIKKASASEGGGLNKLVHKTFYTKVSEAYIREVEELLVNKCGFKFEWVKERYHVKVLIYLTILVVTMCPQQRIPH